MKEYYVIIIVVLAWLVFRFFLRPNQNSYYKCPSCHTEFQPSSWQDSLGPHLIYTRYLKCPHCQKRGWAEVIRK